MNEGIVKPGRRSFVAVVVMVNCPPPHWDMYSARPLVNLSSKLIYHLTPTEQWDTQTHDGFVFMNGKQIAAHDH